MRRLIRLIIGLLICLGLLGLYGCGSPSSAYENSDNLSEDAADNTSGWSNDETPGDINDNSLLKYVSSEELLYAEGFKIDYYEDGFVVLTTNSDGNEYLIVPEGKEVPSDVPDEMIIIQRPVNDIYLVASASMDMFCELDELDSILFSGQKAENWNIDEARMAMEDGSILYAGKYNAPDYEMLLETGCGLVIENTMIFHSPEVLERFDDLGIPYIVDYSSYENHPLGRVEWIKFYGALLDEKEKADSIMDNECAMVDEIDIENTGLKVAYFYVTSNGLVQVRCSNDYIPKMIELAGGEYALENIGDEDSVKSTVNLQIEEFYSLAKDADYIIYNSSIDKSIESVEDIINKCPSIADFRAVKEGNVWCTSIDAYQESLSVGYMIEDMNTMLTGSDKETTYLYHLE